LLRATPSEVQDEVHLDRLALSRLWNDIRSRIGYCLLPIGYWLLAIAYWLLSIGYWLLAIVYWLLSIVYWLLLRALRSSLVMLL
jgi:hypothetical protein